MEYLIWNQLLIFVSYVGYTIYNFGLLPSISDSFYASGETPLFYFFTAALGFLTFGYLQFIESPLLFLAGTSFLFMGTASAFKDWRVTNWVHYVGAVIGIFSYLLMFLLEFELYAPISSFIYLSLLILIADIKNKIFWIEILAFVIIIFSLFHLV